jgi:imidazolonepropionase-like amidohydrolase
MSRLLLTHVNLLDGDNPAVPDRTIVLDGDRIASVFAAPPDPQPGDRVVNLGGRTVMPGMAICHFHATYKDVGRAASGAPYGYEYPPSYQALIAHRNLVRAMEHGYTTVVGAGAARDIEPGLKQAIADGFVPGPRLTPSGRALITTGHANDLSIPWHWELPALGAARVCDGPESFRFAVRDEIKHGVEVIKLFVTGGHNVPGAKDEMGISREELATAIDAAHARNALVRGHISGKGPIMQAIELGIDIIDHCDDMDDEVIAALVDTGISVVPTIHFPTVLARSRAMRPEAVAAIRTGLASMYEVLPKAEAAGVRLLLGDDYGGPGLDHGAYGGEFHTYVEEAGISPLSLIKWATRNGAEAIGRDRDLGTVEAGKLADLLVLEDDPSIDIRAIADRRPLAVLIGGEVASGTLPG